MHFTTFYGFYNNYAHTNVATVVGRVTILKNGSRKGKGNHVQWRSQGGGGGWGGGGGGGTGVMPPPNFWW